MTRDELCEAGRELYGRWGWQTRLAEALDVDGRTVRRWVAGASPILDRTANAVQQLLEEKRSSTRRPTG